jgi:hypothetical protein
VNFGEILLEIVKLLASQLQLIQILLVANTHQHFEPLHLQLGKFELLHVCLEVGLATLQQQSWVGGLVDYALNFDLELLAGEFRLHILEAAQFVGVVNIDEVRLDIMRNGFVVLGLPESSLPPRPSQAKSPDIAELHHNLRLILI